MPRESTVILIAFLKERVAALLSLLTGIGEASRLAGEELLPHQTFVRQVEGVLQHPDGGRAFAIDGLGVFERLCFKVGMVDDHVHHAHSIGLLGVVFPTDEEDLPGEFLPDLACEQCRSVTAVERGDVGVGLLEDGVLAGGDGEIADNMERMAPSGRPARNDRNDRFRHEPDEALDLKDVEPAKSGWVHPVGPFILVSILAADTLVASGAKGPATVLGGWPVSGKKHAADAARHPGMVERPEQFVDGVGAECVPDLGPIKRNANGSMGPGAVVGDVGEVESCDDIPCVGVEQLRNHGSSFSCLPDTVDAVIEDWLSSAARYDPVRPYLVIDGATYSYADVDARASRLAGALRAEGVIDGDRVALWARNDLSSVVALFAVWRAGAGCVLVNTRLTDAEVAEELEEAGVSLMIDDGERGWSVPSISNEAMGTPYPGEAHRGDSECLVVFTSGSAGQGRGVVLTWANVDAGQAASAEHLNHTGNDVWLAVLPIFHVGGASILIRSAARRSTVILHDRFEPAVVADSLSRVSIASFVATQVAAILDLDERTYDVRAVLVGGGPAKQTLLERAHRRGLGVLSTYGMTEAGSQIATSPIGEPPRRVVVPIPGAEMRLVNGVEIEVRGPMVTTTYLDSVARLADGWLKTGDLGEVVEDGFRIIGRTSDVIISGGENVMADEVKDALEALECVRSAAVVGIPDDTWGEVVAAAIELDADVSFDDLSDELRQTLAGYKIPKVWRMVESLPRTSLGKIRRQAVRNLFS